MTTSLDRLILVVLALAPFSLVAMVLMFLVKNRTVKRVCLYLAAALSHFLGYAGLRIMWPLYLGQSVIAVAAALGGIGAVVLERLSRKNEKRFLAAQILASASLIVGMFNAFL